MGSMLLEEEDFEEAAWDEEDGVWEGEGGEDWERLGEEDVEGEEYYSEGEQSTVDSMGWQASVDLASDESDEFDEEVSFSHEPGVSGGGTGVARTRRKWSPSKALIRLQWSRMVLVKSQSRWGRKHVLPPLNERPSFLQSQSQINAS